MEDKTTTMELSHSMLETIVSGIAQDMVYALVQEAVEQNGQISLDSVKTKWQKRADDRARLNDAAPDLLAALEFMVANIGEPACLENRDGFAAARAAIARARGEA